jgi:hypothetical protein
MRGAFVPGRGEEDVGFADDGGEVFEESGDNHRVGEAECGDETVEPALGARVETGEEEDEAREAMGEDPGGEDEVLEARGGGAGGDGEDEPDLPGNTEGAAELGGARLAVEGLEVERRGDAVDFSGRGGGGAEELADVDAREGDDGIGPGERGTERTEAGRPGERVNGGDTSAGRGGECGGMRARGGGGEMHVEDVGRELAEVRLDAGQSERGERGAAAEVADGHAEVAEARGRGARAFQAPDRDVPAAAVETREKREQVLVDVGGVEGGQEVEDLVFHEARTLEVSGRRE